MLFLRLTVFLIIALGIFIYLISTRLRSEFIDTGGKIIPQFRGNNAEYKAFCKNPPTPYAAKLLELKKKLSIALIIAVLVFLLAALLAILHQT
jgi:hypothetical protein